MELFAAFTALSAIGSVSQGMAARDAARSEAKSIETSAQYNEQIRKAKARKMIGTQIVQATSGGGFSPSNYEVIADTAIQSDLQGQIDLFNASNQASAARQQGSIAFGQGITGAIGQIGTFGSMYAYDKFSDIRTPRKTTLPDSYGSNIAAGGFFT